jgi:hypothetical protein
MSLIPYGTLYDALWLIFWLVLTFAGFAFLYSWRPKRNRKAVPRMYVDAKPYKDDRDSIAKFKDIEFRREPR